MIKIEKLTITPGRKTWGIGLLLDSIGVLFLLPDIHSAINSSPVPTPVDRVAPSMTSSPPTKAGVFSTIVQPTFVNIVSPTETVTLRPLSQVVSTMSPQSIACVTSQTGTGALVEVQADSLMDYIIAKPKLPLVNGEEIPFHIMRSFEVIEISENRDRVGVTITLLNGDTVTDDVPYSWDHFTGTAKYGSFSMNLADVKRIEFREQGGCQ